VSGTCLVVVDLQNDFMPGGGLKNRDGPRFSPEKNVVCP
jgi:nicotinamidase-related amidase